MKSLVLLFYTLSILSCEVPSSQKNLVDAITSQNYHDKIHALLNNALKSDSLVFDDIEPFIYFKAGNFLSTEEKNALVVYAQNDSSSVIALYTVSNKQWKLNDSISGLEISQIQFNPHFDDYNFDGQTDIYIQVSASNGYVLSRGNLLTIHPITKKLEFHPEARDLANMQPDPQTQSVISDELIWCKTTGFTDICKHTYKWKNGVLTFLKKECPCELHD